MLSFFGVTVVNCVLFIGLPSGICEKSSRKKDLLRIDYLDDFLRLIYKTCRIANVLRCNTRRSNGFDNDNN